MQCNLKSPNCNEIHEVNSRYCTNCDYDLEPYIISFKHKHLPIRFTGAGVGVGVGVGGDDFCECCEDFYWFFGQTTWSYGLPSFHDSTYGGTEISSGIYYYRFC